MSRKRFIRALGATAAFMLLAGSAQAAPVTFYFGGRIADQGIGRHVAGSITYDTAASEIVDSRGPGDLGDRLLYRNAITEWTFDTGLVSRTVTNGHIAVWNDYLRCIQPTADGGCAAPHQAEADRIMFSFDVLGEQITLILLGNWLSGDPASVLHSYLDSSALPNDIPALDTGRVDFFWYRETPDGFEEIASNWLDVAATPFPDPRTLPEPGSAGLLLLGGALLAARKLRPRS